METVKLIKDLDKTELSLLIYIVVNTMGPSGGLKWSTIRNGIRDSSIYRGYTRLDKYDDNGFNVRITRSLERLREKGYVEQWYEGRNSFYGVHKPEIREIIKEYSHFGDHSTVFLECKIPLPSKKVNNVFEFRDFLINDNFMFLWNLIQVFDEYKLMWNMSNPDDQIEE